MIHSKVDTVSSSVNVSHHVHVRHVVAGAVVVLMVTIMIMIVAMSYKDIDVSALWILRQDKGKGTNR